jgi:hypothetical protein
MDPLEQETKVDDLEERRLKSISQQAEGAEPEEPEELFPLGSLEGDELTPQKLIKKGAPVQVTVSIGSAEVPMPSGGLLDPERTGKLIVSYAFKQQTEVPQRDGEDITGWKIRQELRATHVRSANDPVKLIKDEYAAVLGKDEAGAGRLLEELKEMFAKNVA